MRSSPSVSRAGIFFEATGLGCAIGVLHAVAETTLLALNNVRPSAVDLLILVTTYAGAGFLLAGLVGLAAMAKPLRAKLGLTHGALAMRRAAWTVLIGGYVLVFLKIIFYWSGWKSLLWLAAATPALLVAGLAVYRRGQRALVPLCGAALVAATLCALQLAQTGWAPGLTSPLGFAMRLLLPAVICLAALVAAYKTTSRERQFEPIARGAVPLGALLAVWAGCWAGLDSSFSFGRLLDAAPAAASATRPNFLLIVLDTVRADHLDLFGYERETMPNLRRFARESQVANPMFTTGSWTVPSHGSMFTGLYPSAHGAHHLFVHDDSPGGVAYSLREDIPTLAEYLGSHGYQTAGIVSNYATLSAFGLQRGFEHYDVSAGAAFNAPNVLWLYRARLGGLSVGQAFRELLPAAIQDRSRVFSVREPSYRRAREITNTARQWLDRNGRRPFFLFLNYMDAHIPYLPIAEDDERFVKRPPGEEWFGFPNERFAASTSGAGTFTPQEIEFLKGQYDAELVSLDRELGRLLDYLGESGFLENTLIFITTDHGEAFFEHGFLEHGNSVYQEEIGGFLVIKAPPLLGPVQASPLMQFVDFFPTMALILEQPIPDHVQGLPWGRGRDHALSEKFCKGCGREWLDSMEWPDASKDELVAVIRGDRKLIRSLRNPDEVYDLSSDPAESRPMADPDPEWMRQAEEILAARGERLVEGLSKHPKDKDLLEKLRSLGYIN